MAACMQMKRKIYRCIHRLCLFNIAFFVWIFFMISLFSLMVTYISFVFYLDDDERTRDKNLENDMDFPVADGVDEVLLLQEGIVPGEDAQTFASGNLISSHIIDSSAVEIAGWWMPQVRWNPEIDCSLPDQPGTCGKVLSVKCKPDSVRAIYQFLPINQDKPIDGIYFHAKSAASKLTKDKQVASDATYSAIALLRYKDGASDRIRLDFPAGTHPYLSAEVDKIFPVDKVLQSVTVMLCCHGYQGSIKFMDVIVRPILEDHSQVMVTKNYIQKCPEYCRSSKTSSRFDFDVEQFLTDGTQLTEGSQPLTLVTQVSLDRIDLLESALEHWQGPISVALFIPTKSSKTDNDHGWKRLYIKKKLRNSHLQGRCNMVVVFAKTSEDEYPVNYLRNLAIRQAKTKYIFLLDADFVPAPDFQSSFQTSLAMIERTPQFNKTAFVVPVFEYAQEFIKDFPVDQPKNKQDLKDKLFSDGAIISPFMISTAPEAHRPTDYRSWYSATRPYKVSTYQDKYEPYLILRNTENLPLFDERFTGYGMNKVTYAMELHASGYEYMVLPNVWAVHVPHRESSAKIRFLLDPLYRLNNRADRFEFVSDLMRRHNLGGCKADQH
ncbi:LARGE xylosyl- and glucuronyltransferase 2-A-like [Patiria miniata]|uniref:Uncharacterized protein n=1 Tax=Patiria miniata TaxID=46514 RepID=A0A914BR65_PATMI|nr:LARGE xylosyl- and glucuronyltransferase 2-A-like [Patiria miniata]